MAELQNKTKRRKVGEGAYFGITQTLRVQLTIKVNADWYISVGSGFLRILTSKKELPGQLAQTCSGILAPTGSRTASVSLTSSTDAPLRSLANLHGLPAKGDMPTVPSQARCDTFMPCHAQRLQCRLFLATISSISQTDP